MKSRRALKQRNKPDSADMAFTGLTYWTNDASEHPAHTYAYYAGIYALLMILGLLSLLLLGYALFIISIKRAGANLHREALRTLIRAPLRFFTTTDTGVVTNLFSQDLNLLDTELPDATLNTLFCVSLMRNASKLKCPVTFPLSLVCRIPVPL
jgi:ABC-type multidrug transport system fused ATPase/permease subunit